jgi:hypothetical protein
VRKTLSRVPETFLAPPIFIEGKKRWQIDTVKV